MFYCLTVNPLLTDSDMELYYWHLRDTRKGRVRLSPPSPQVSRLASDEGDQRFAPASSR